MAHPPCARRIVPTLLSDLHPPRPPLAFRVAITGHRPARLVAGHERLAAALRQLLGDIASEVHRSAAAWAGAYDTGTPTLVALSSLAEGADQAFAQVALDSGWMLSAVLPFDSAETRRDLLPPMAMRADSLARFDLLLAHRNTRVLELDGRRERARDAYTAAGQMLASQCDLLVLVWDGRHSPKRGGSQDTAGRARRAGVPVLWIDAAEPERWQLLEGSQRLPRVEPDDLPARPEPAGQRERLHACLRRQIEPPPQPPAMASRWTRRLWPPTLDTTLEGYHRAPRPGRHGGLVWRMFRELVGHGRWRMPAPRPAEPTAEPGSEWAVSDGAADDPIVRALWPAYAWADRLSVAAADRYRSAFIAVYLLAALAVGLALLPLALGVAHGHGPLNHAATAGELVAIVAVLLIVVAARRGGWHVRWIDYRVLAELLRHLRLVAPLGGQRPLPALSAHLGEYDPGQRSWMAWTARAWERSLRLPVGRVDRAFLGQALRGTVVLVGDARGRGGQLAYHRGAERLNEHLAHRLHAAGYALFGLTLVCCVLHLMPLPTAFGSWLTFGAAFMPALGASLAGIANTGEFRRVAKRSAAMSERLHGLAQRLEAHLARVAGDATGDAQMQQPSVTAAELADEAARLMVTEVLDWRVVLIDRPPELPA